MAVFRTEAKHFGAEQRSVSEKIMESTERMCLVFIEHHFTISVRFHLRIHFHRFACSAFERNSEFAHLVQQKLDQYKADDHTMGEVRAYPCSSPAPVSSRPLPLLLPPTPRRSLLPSSSLLTFFSSYLLFLFFSSFSVSSHNRTRRVQYSDSTRTCIHQFRDLS